MKTKKVYLNRSDISSVQLIFVHPDYEASAVGAKMAREDGNYQSETLIQVTPESVHVIDANQHVTHGASKTQR